MRNRTEGDASGLISALGISRGIVSFVGAGGKKSGVVRRAKA
jgi:hypothetical protein